MRRPLLSAIWLAAMIGLASPHPTLANTLRFAYQGDVNSLDPYAFTESFSIAFMLHVYETLVRYDEELDIEPALATEWEVVEPTLWRFKLRGGVNFHNDNPFTADDVVASIERVLTSPLKTNLPSVTGARKIDDHTVEIDLSGADPLLLNGLSNIAIFDAEWLEEHDAMQGVDPSQGEDSYASTHANGTGPFMVESRRPDAETVLVVNPDWWDEPRHNLERIVFTPIASDATRVAALLSGEIDFMYPAPLQDIPRLEAAPEVVVLEAPSLRVILLLMDHASDALKAGDPPDANPLADVRVRKALYQAIDMDLIRERIMRGKSRNGALLVAPPIPGYDASLDERFPHDPEAAKALLAEAGYPDGFTVDLYCPNDRYVNDEEICQAITAMWARLGLDVNLTAQTKSQHFNQARGGEADVFMVGWATLPLMDAFSPISAFLNTPRGGLGSWNVGGYHNARIDELTDELQYEFDKARRQEITSEILRIARDEVAVLPLHEQPIAWAMRTGTGIMQFPDEKLRLWHTRMAE